MLIILIESSLMFSLIKIVQKCDLNWVHYKIDFYIFIQHISMHLILISISTVDSNIKILKTWTKSSMNQETKTDQIVCVELNLKAFIHHSFSYIFQEWIVNIF
jgi:hypothetical protein